MEVLSLVVGVVSIVLAIVSMISSKNAEKQSLHNFEKTQELLQKSYNDTKDLLAEIDKKAAVIDSVVHEEQEKLMTTLTNIVNETAIPKKKDIGEEIGAQIISDMFKNPDQAQGTIKSLETLAELFEKFPQEKDDDKL